MLTKERLTISIGADLKAMLEETVPASKRSAFCASVIEEGLKEKRRQDAIANLRARRCLSRTVNLP